MPRSGEQLANEFHQKIDERRKFDRQEAINDRVVVAFMIAAAIAFVLIGMNIAIVMAQKGMIKV